MGLRSIKVKEKTWTIWDVRPSRDAGGDPPPVWPELAAGWLCFETDGEKRRLAGVPDGWSRWAEAELCDALARAEPLRWR